MSVLDSIILHSDYLPHPGLFLFKSVVDLAKQLVSCDNTSAMATMYAHVTK